VCELKKKKKKEKTKRFLQKFADLYLGNGLEDLIMWLLFMEANSTVNLVPFGEDIAELRIGENCDFVVPVNILTPLVHTLFSTAAQHTTVCLDTVCMFKLKPL